MYNIFRYVSQSMSRLLTRTTHKSTLYTASLKDNTSDDVNTAAGRTQDLVKPIQLPGTH